MRGRLGRENINGPKIFFKKIVPPYGVAQLNYTPFAFCSDFALAVCSVSGRGSMKSGRFPPFSDLFVGLRMRALTHGSV